jgi:hypothetical protein
VRRSRSTSSHDILFLTLVLTNNYILLLCGLMNVSSKSRWLLSFVSLSRKNSLVQKHKFFRHHKNKSSSPIIVDNMSAIAQSAISFGTFPPSYPTFARDRDRNVSVSPVSSFVVLLWVLFLSFFYSFSSSFLWSVLSGTRRDEERCMLRKEY